MQAGSQARGPTLMRGGSKNQPTNFMLGGPMRVGPTCIATPIGGNDIIILYVSAGKFHR